MENALNRIRIYVACLASYNNGILHGKWIDATLGENHIWQGIKEVLETSTIEDAEEYAVHDYEGFENITISEYESVAQICAYAEFIEEHGELGGNLYEYLGDLESARTYLSENYQGVYETVADYAEELTESTTEIPEHLKYYIDYKAMARDLEINDILAIEINFDGVHIFWQS